MRKYGEQGHRVETGRRIYFVAAAILVLLLNPPVYGQVKVLEPIRFSETLRSDAPVVGGVFRGIHAGSAFNLANLSELYVTIPPGDYSRLCLEVETQDGQYFAEASYDISGNRSLRRYRVQLPTKHHRFIESRPIRDVSVVTYISKTCDSEERIYVPVQWQADEGSRGLLMVLVNARSPSVVVRIYDVEERRYFECRRDTETKRLVAFDTECLMELSPGPRFAKFVLIRTRGLYHLENVEIKAYLP